MARCFISLKATDEQQDIGTGILHLAQHLICIFLETFVLFIIIIIFARVTLYFQDSRMELCLRVSSPLIAVI